MFFSFVDKVPDFARCTFESGQCGWKFHSESSIRGSVDSSQDNGKSQISWKLQTGPAPNSEQSGPSVDHTFHNASGNWFKLIIFLLFSNNAIIQLRNEIGVQKLWCPYWNSGLIYNN